MPPEWMWHLTDELEEWFAEVERRRRDRYGLDKDEDRDAPEMLANELARGRR